MLMEEEMFGAEILEGRVTQSTEDAAAYDVYAECDTVIPARGRAIVNTGVRLALKKGFTALFSHRSGINFNHGQINPLGIIDYDYREKEHIIRANFYNMTDEDYVIKKGERVAQLLILQRFGIKGAEKTYSKRTGGFGSTGK